MKLKEKALLGLIAGLLPASFAAWNPSGPARQGPEPALTFSEQLIQNLQLDTPQIGYRRGQQTGEWIPSENPLQEVPYSPAFLLKTELAHLNPTFVGELPKSFYAPNGGITWDEYQSWTGGSPSGSLF